MKKPNITKGEWRHGVINNGHEHFKDYSHYVSVPENEMVICNILENHSFEESEANAKAMSAVPEMIDALIDIKYQLKSLSNNDKYDLLDTVDFSEIEKALKKAGCNEH